MSSVHKVLHPPYLSLVILFNTNITGLDCTNRLFISDRAHLVFDFHQIVDGLKEVELGGSRFAHCSFHQPAVYTPPSLQLASEQQRKVSARLTLGKPHDLAFVCTTYLTTTFSRRSSARSSRVGLSVTVTLNTTRKARYYVTRSVISKL
jgi:hypothetical protein